MGKQAKPSKQTGKRKSLAVVKEPKAKKPKPAKAPAPKPSMKKDPNQPKKPATAFFIFLEEFRKSFKKDHPDSKGVAAVGKAGGDKWKEMTDQEKASYVAKAAKRKADYDKDLKAYNSKKSGKEAEEDEDGGSAGESEEKSKRAADDEEEEEETEDEDE